MYGGMIRNQNGEAILNEKEVPMSYWGKFSFTVPAFVSGQSLFTTPILNIPSSIPFTIFTRVTYLNQANKTLSADFAMFVDRNAALARIRAYNRAYTGAGRTKTFISVKVDVYVFMPCRYIPLPEWGLAIYNADGSVAFHTGRPYLNLAGFNTTDGSNFNWVGSKEVSNAHAGLNTLLDTQYITSGSGQAGDLYTTFEGYVFYTGATTWQNDVVNSVGAVIKNKTKADVGYVAGYVLDNTPNINASLPISIDSYQGSTGIEYIAVPYISTTEYDRYSSLGNYS